MTDYSFLEDEKVRNVTVWRIQKDSDLYPRESGADAHWIYTRGNKMNIRGRRYSLRRLVWHLYRSEEEIPDDKRIKTSCGFSNCLNPDHLYV